MTMTKKDYELIAKAFMDFASGSDEDEQPIIDKLAEYLGEQLKATNPLFDEVRFLLSCGIAVSVRGIEVQQSADQINNGNNNQINKQAETNNVIVLTTWQHQRTDKRTTCGIAYGQRLNTGVDHMAI